MRPGVRTSCQIHAPARTSLGHGEYALAPDTRPSRTKAEPLATTDRRADFAPVLAPGARATASARCEHRGEMYDETLASVNGYWSCPEWTRRVLFVWGGKKNLGRAGAAHLVGARGVRSGRRGASGGGGKFWPEFVRSAGVFLADCHGVYRRTHFMPNSEDLR